MLWKSAVVLGLCGLIALLCVAVRMGQNRQDVLYHSVASALEKAYREISLSSTNEASLKAVRFSPDYCRTSLVSSGNSGGMLPSFVTLNDILLPVEHSKPAGLLIAVRINEQLACGLYSMGRCEKLVEKNIADWDHIELSASS